ncbi:iron-containing alcohol dehydrogenase [Glycomyces sp. TRM65418]|uniref:iron-containing alcohol dehydrogenase n=1 Tax=Glycomyces sp. TRM65418 TaxID=2867006 RepID=UPI001CE5871F|nr:iron-containing alcohol dehydrogenase [Glycomyces sp. TRM65418]MCC3765517.1 iron-containing alcohol dehydrogenase [Glycomyces sp. TRM65418]QZD55124.1 iron-containing alcohol dehydrogenase [Glycomyces sp. TRM65418]
MTVNPPATAVDWQVPTLIGFGSGRAADLGPQAAALGSAPAVLIDARVAESETGRDLLARLSAHGVPAVSVTRVAGVPTLDAVVTAVDAVTACGADLVVGIGGGSTMDTAKLAALASTNFELLESDRWRSGPLLDLDGERGAHLRPGLPSLLLPTTTATGSELNSVAAVVHEGQRRLMVSGRLASTSALIDPDLSASLPTAAVIEGGVETLARIVCPYLAGAALDVTDALAETLAAQCLAALDRLSADPADAQARAELVWIVAVSATQLVGLGRGRYDHVLWYLQDPLCTIYGLPKGRTMSALLPAYLAAIGGGGAIGPRLGDADRLSRLDRAVAVPLGRATFAEALSQRLAAWDMPVCLEDLGGIDIERVALACHESWHLTGRLSGVERPELVAFFGSASGGPAHHEPRLAATPSGAEIPLEGGD